MSTAPHPTPPASALAQRILETARVHISKLGLRAVTMDDLARELGISKKTLYLHFPSKDAIVEQIVDLLGRTMRARFDAILADSTLSFAQKACAVFENCSNTVAQVSPALLRDLQRDAPAIFQKIENLRKKKASCLSPIFSEKLSRPSLDFIEGRIEGRAFLEP